MTSVLITTLTDQRFEPRVVRQVRALSSRYDVITAGLGDPAIDGVPFIQLTRRRTALPQKGAAFLQLLLRRYEGFYRWSNEVPQNLEALSIVHPDLIVAHDMSLPLAVMTAGDAKVIFDAHEYLPRQYEDRLLQRLVKSDFNGHVCNTYIPKVNGMLTVCDGIAEQYERDTGVRAEVWHNTPFFERLEPQLRGDSNGRIRMVHHGLAMPSRRIEGMIEMMGYLDDRFELDFFLVAGENDRYLTRLKRIARGDRRIRFRPPVAMSQLVQRTNQYDLGVFLLPPTSFSYRHALPNKFFEFIQARIGVAIGPSPEMARIVERHDCGVVAEEFAPQSLASAIRGLDHEQINHFKRQANSIAWTLSAERGAEQLLSMIERVLGT